MILKDKTAIITGGGRGLGKAIAQKLSSEGAEVFLLGRNEEALRDTCREIKASGGSADYFAANLNDDGKVSESVKRAVERYGKIDILVNNAGISKEIPFLNMTMEVWDEILNTNLRTLVVMTKNVLPYMVEKKSGNIVNIGSGAGIRGLPGSAAYSSSKAAVICLTQSLGDEMRSYGIRLNVICPGPVDTELFQKSARREFILAAGGDVFEPDTVANGVVFLASDLSKGMNSQILTMRGFNRW